MPHTGGRDGASRTKRKSLFALSSLTHIHPPKEEKSNGEGLHRLRKRRVTASSDRAPPTVDLIREDEEDAPAAAATQASPGKQRRPSLTLRSTGHRPSSVLGSLRSLRSNEDDQIIQTPKSAEAEISVSSTKTVLHHGEVQTSGSMFRKKKEYLVLTETHIVRFKSQAKASEVFHSIPPSFGRSPTIRHSSSQSIGSAQDAHSFGSDSSGDKEGKIPLRQVVAIYAHEDGRPYFALEVCSLEEESNQASAMTLQFNQPEERDTWMSAIRSAASTMRSIDPRPISHYNANYIARTVEREGDYDPSQFQLYKVVQRSSHKIGGRSSTDDLSKIISVVCFLAIGIHKVHLIPLPKTSSRTSSPALSQSAHGAHGILTINAVKVSRHDDSVELTFRQPLKRTKTLHLASLASHDIALKIHSIEHFLRPECAHWLYKFNVPPEVEERVTTLAESNEEDHCSLDRTLTAYCIAYDVNPARIRYTINYECEDAPRFELMPIADPRRSEYNPIELLAVMRALRYNESFCSISFADICLDSLHGLFDGHGVEYVCVRTKRGTPLKLSHAELSRASLLIQEVRALASTSKRLRRLDFSGCIRIKPPETLDDGEYRAKDVGCGIAEALFPLCRHQTTNIDWIALNGIVLSDSDLDYLVGAAVDRNCHFRALELSRCGLSDRSLGLVLDALRAHENTLEALDISGNSARLSPAVFDSQISVFGFIRRLDLSNLPRTSGSEPLLTTDTLLTWRLEELRLSGVGMNERTVDALASYLRSPKSSTLHELILDNAFLSGKDIATLMEAMSSNSEEARNLHLDISHNNIYREHDKLCAAFIAGHSPTHVTLRAMEYRDEGVLRHLLNALRQNHSTRSLDISRASLPTDASDELSVALERLFAENDTLEEIDISGEESRLETSKFGKGLNGALHGLKSNTMLKVIRVEFQKLGLPGASVLAEVLKENDVLREMHCANNEIPLSAFTDLVNALLNNTSLLYLPMMEEGRAMALRQTEKQVKQIRDEASAPANSPSSPMSKASSFGMRRGLASVKRNVSRSSHSPSFPSLNSSSTPPLANATPKSRVANSSIPASAPLPQLSEQDVIAALRLVAESWDRQQYRLQQYLQRNWCILQGIDVPLTIQDEDFERPDSISVTSLAGVLEKVKIDSTPTMERQTLDFPPSATSTVPASPTLTTRHVRSRSTVSTTSLDERLTRALATSPAFELTLDTGPFSHSPAPGVSPVSPTWDDENGDETMSPADDEGLEIHGLGIRDEVGH